MQLAALSLALLIAFTTSACTGQVPDPSGRAVVPAVPLDQVISTPWLYHGKVVRVAGYCRIEFEGNGLYVDERAVHAHRGEPTGVWLDLRRSVSREVSALSGRFVAVEAKVDAESHGHYGMYRAGLKDIRFIVASTPEHERARIASGYGLQ